METTVATFAVTAAGATIVAGIMTVRMLVERTRERRSQRER